MERIKNAELLKKVTTPEAAASCIKNGMTVAVSGFTVVGYPKVIPAELAKRADNGEDLKITLITGGNVGDEVDGVLSRSHVLARRYGFQNNKDLRAQINSNEVKFVDTHVGGVPHLIKNGFLGKLDVGIIEIAGTTEDGKLIPCFSAGITNVIAKYAEKIILEVNETVPLAVEGMHDFIDIDRAPNAQPILISSPVSRVGSPYVTVDFDKVVGIVYSDKRDTNKDLAPANEEQTKIAELLIDFLKDEMKAGRLSTPLPPMQSGVGGVANAVLTCLAESDLTDLSVYTEVMQDAVIALIDSGKVTEACGTALTISPSKLDDFYNNIDFYKEKIVLRPQEISNSAEVIRRLGVIAMNTAIEVDLAGNVNSTHTNGVNLMNGIGGSSDYAKNAGLCVFTTPSTAKNGTISCIVPHCGHVDHTEHDTQIIITEYGLADLRGLTAYERAELLIEKCAHPKFRPMLREYIENAKKNATGFHDIL